MKLSSYPITTFREDPKDVEMASLRLLLRSGMLMFVTGGVYAYTHFLTRVIQKITEIVRQEMNRAGAVEIAMPILQPKGLWEKTGRWDDYLASHTMLHLKDRQGAELGLGPTAEEVVTFLASLMITSYRQLPTTLYQIGPKFRDELRLRGGLIRGREFVMKDAYSFDADAEGLEASYQAQRRAYERAFARCGLPFLQVEADSGAIGGSSSHEFMVVAPAGEDKVITCIGCDYKANVERAVSALSASEPEGEKPMHLEATPDARTVDDLVALFAMSASRLVKTILYDVTYKDGRTEVVAVLMRGDCDINEVKLGNHLGDVANMETAAPEVVMDATKAEVGFAGPVGLKTRIVADESVRPLKNFLCGGNKTGYHLLDVNWGRDFPEPVFADLRTVADGEACVHCGSALQITRGIEVGHLFKLGTKYSHKPDKQGNPYGLGATYLDEAGAAHDIVMGCYGIGITRIAAAAVEISHDDKGIIWPFSIAPYEVVIITAGSDPGAEQAAAEKLYEDLNQAGVDAAYDDRDERIGVKLNDADLMGFPFKIIVGRGLQKGVVDLKDRKTGETISLPVAEAVEKVRIIAQERRDALIEQDTKEED